MDDKLYKMNEVMKPMIKSVIDSVLLKAQSQNLIAQSKENDVYAKLRFLWESNLSLVDSDYSSTSISSNNGQGHDFPMFSSFLTEIVPLIAPIQGLPGYPCTSMPIPNVLLKPTTGKKRQWKLPLLPAKRFAGDDNVTPEIIENNANDALASKAMCHTTPQSDIILGMLVMVDLSVVSSNRTFSNKWCAGHIIYISPEKKRRSTPKSSASAPTGIRVRLCRSRNDEYAVGGSRGEVDALWPSEHVMLPEEYVKYAHFLGNSPVNANDVHTIQNMSAVYDNSAISVNTHVSYDSTSTNLVKSNECNTWRSSLAVDNLIQSTPTAMSQAVPLASNALSLLLSDDVIHHSVNKEMHEVEEEDEIERALRSLESVTHDIGKAVLDDDKYADDEDDFLFKLLDGLDDNIDATNNKGGLTDEMENALLALEDATDSILCCDDNRNNSNSGNNGNKKEGATSSSMFTDNILDIHHMTVDFNSSSDEFVTLATGQKVTAKQLEQSEQYALLLTRLRPTFSCVPPQGTISQLIADSSYSMNNSRMRNSRKSASFIESVVPSVPDGGSGDFSDIILSPVEDPSVHVSSPDITVIGRLKQIVRHHQHYVFTLYDVYVREMLPSPTLQDSDQAAAQHREWIVPLMKVRLDGSDLFPLTEEEQIQQQLHTGSRLQKRN